MDTSIVRQMQEKVASRYPNGKSKIALSFLRTIVIELDRFLAHSKDSRSRHEMMAYLRSLYEKAQNGMSASDFHRELGRFGEIMGGEVGSGDSSASIHRLERQLRELRDVVSATPSDMERRFRDLQEQVESLREDMVDTDAISPEKQEDMLQKFKSAEKKAFIIMPFARDFDNVWQGAIKTSCSESHYAALRVDEVSLSSLITDDIETYSSMADVVIVDLTGNNPNVMFELGWSLAKNKKPIVICQGEHANKVAFDVRGIRHIPYENSWLGIESLKKRLKEFITATETHSRSKTKKTAAKSSDSKDMKT